MLKLIITNGESVGREFVLRQGENLIGRSRSTDIRLSSMDVSGRHARLMVEGDCLYVENLSQYNTFVDGETITERTRLLPGQCLKTGKTVEFKLNLVDATVETQSGGGAAGVSEPPAEADTGEGLTAAAGATGTFDNDLTMDATAAAFAEDEEGATRAMHTRAATPDEIEHLKIKETQRIRYRMFMIIGGVAVLLTLGVIFRPRTQAPELELRWPVNEQDLYLNSFEPSRAGGREKGDYDIRYPANGTFTKSDSPGGFTLAGFVGRNRDVPMRIIVQEELDLRFASMSSDEIVRDWIDMISAGGKAWRIDKPSALTLFFGDKNGVPYTRTSYLRDDAGASWFGIANIFRHGRRRIVVRSEAPAVEQTRVESLLTSRLVYVADEFQFSYWPYVRIGESVPVETLLEQVRRDMERMAPGTWMSINRMLCGILSRVVPAQDAESEKESLRLLRKLRGNEALWFNSQQLAFESAVFRGDLKHAKKVMVFTKGVFSDMSDQRYYTVRKWNVEL